MPRPAPSTVPVSSPITKLPPPPPSLSNRSYPSAMFCLLSLPFVGLVVRARVKHRLDRDAQPADEADDAARLRADAGSDPNRRVLCAMHFPADGLRGALCLFLDLRRH